MATTTSATGRDDLDRWVAARPTNFYAASPKLALLLARHLEATELVELEPKLHAFGGAVAAVIDPLVATAEANRSAPSLAPRDALGRSRQEVEFDGSRRAAGRAAWDSGLLATPPTRAGAFEQAALAYLLTQAGEGGLTCPVACTAGLIRALREHAPPELRERFLPPLLDTDFDRAQRGAQFLTEVQGGSDVGANTTRAWFDADLGEWRLSGEKWFCSVADADQFFVTARPEGAAAGTRGLACFVVPRLDEQGDPNGFRIERLKDKLGTRVLATGEITFDGALAYPIGALDEGFKIAVGVVLNTSRWLNAIGSTALMRRAYLEAASFAAHRTAFGSPIATYPLVRENLAVLKAEELAALASTLELTALVGAIDAGTASVEDRAFHRFLVNANKFVTSLTATRVVRRAIETLGGNGTIEDFSPLPRLYRDAIVLESWEGTHNVLCAQILRDLGRLSLLDPVLERAHRLPGSDRVAELLDAVALRLRRSLEEPEWGALHGRRQLWELTRAIQVAALPADDDECDAAAQLLLCRELVVGWRAEDDDGYPALIERVLAGED